MTGLRRVFVYPSRVDEFQEFFSTEFPSRKDEFGRLFNGDGIVKVLPLPAAVMKQVQLRKFIHTSNKNTKRYTANQRNWIATFIFAAYAASRMDQLPHLPSELLHMILEMVRRADADKDNVPVDTTQKMLPF